MFTTKAVDRRHKGLIGGLRRSGSAGVAIDGTAVSGAIRVHRGRLTRVDNLGQSHGVHQILTEA
jgi:hypothetical protein